jgi:hypothetical protein
MRAHPFRDANEPGGDMSAIETRAEEKWQAEYLPHLDAIITTAQSLKAKVTSVSRAEFNGKKLAAQLELIEFHLAMCGDMADGPRYPIEEDE